MRSRGKIVLWPSYFDLDLSSSQGRDVPKKMAARGVRADEIFKAAVDLGFKAELNGQAAHPSRPWDKKGMVLIEKGGPKREILHKIAQRIKENRF